MDYHEAPAARPAGFRRALAVVLAPAAVAILLMLAGVGGAEAACTSNAPASSTTDDCSGANVTGVIAAASTNVTLNLLTGGSITPAAGPSIWLGADADIRLQGGTVTGNNTIANNYAVLMGDSSIVTLDGTIQSQGGITGPTQGGGSTGFSNALITINSTGHILTTGTAYNAALDGRAGGNTYIINGEIKASGRSGAGIAPGNNDQIAVGGTGSITTLFGDTSNPIDGFGKTGVTVTTAAGSLIELHGIGRAIQLGANANVTVGGTIRSYGDAAITASAGGVGVEVGPNSTVWLKQGGQIVTGNTVAPGGGLNNGGTGGIGISTFQAGTGSNTRVIVDGLIDTQKALGIFAGTGDNITIGATGKITTRGTASAISGSTYTSVGHDQFTLDIAGRVEQLGTGRAFFLSASNAGGAVTPLRAHVTVEEGGSLFAQANQAYGQDDGCCGFPEVIDDLIVKGTIARGNAGTVIDLNDGADTITLFPTYAITGNIDGGTDANGNPETDTFALDGAAGTNGTFNFATNTVTHFEAGKKSGLGTWTLMGNPGAGIAGTFAVEAGRLAVNGAMTSTDFNVLPGGVIGGTGSIKVLTASGTVAPGNSIGVLTAATALFNAGSLFEVELDPTSADKLAVTGTATIDSAARVSALAAPGTYTDGKRYLVLDAGTRVGTFGGVVDNSAFLDFTLDQTIPNQVWLQIAKVVSFPDVAETPNQKAAATGLQGQGPGDPLYQAVLLLDVASAQKAFDLASGEIHAAVRGALLDDSRFVREAILDRLHERFDAAFGAAPLAYAQAAGPIIAPAAGPVTSIWGQGYGSGATYAGDGNAAALGRSLSGFVAGVDASTDMWRFGLAGGYQSAGIDLSARASSASVDAYQFAAYGGIDKGPLAFRFGGVVGAHTVATSRQITIAGFSDTLTARYAARSAQAFGEVAYRARLAAVDVEPFANLAGVTVATDGFSESGGPAALSAAPQSQTVAFTSIGARFATAFPVGRTSLKLNALLAWRHAFGGTPTSSLAFAGGAPFTVAGVPIAQDALRVEAGVEWNINRRTTLALGFSGEIASGVQDLGAKARFSVHF